MTLQSAFNEATQRAASMTEPIFHDFYTVQTETTDLWKQFAEDDIAYIKGVELVTFQFPRHTAEEVQEFVNTKLRVNVHEACGDTVTILARDAGIPWHGPLTLEVVEGGAYDPFVCTHCGDADAAEDHSLCVECKAQFDREEAI